MPAGFGENYSSHVHRRDEKLYLDPICNASRFEKVVPGFYGYRYRELGIITFYVSPQFFYNYYHAHCAYVN